MYKERASRFPGAVVWVNAPVGDGRVLPDGCMDLLWHEERLLVAGPDTRAYVTGTGGGEWVGLRFYPGTAPPVLGVPAHELVDRRVELSDLWPAAEVARLRDRVGRAADPAAALEEIALERALPPDPSLWWLVEVLDTGRSVAAAAGELGLGARQLQRRSRAAFGYGPKTLARVLRMQRALALARAGVPLAETAVRAGYADQPHLSRDVRELAGLPLTGLLGG
ncbi:MAG: helix-turn-helix transcriptional regulator [Streptomyces sp.]|uniref:helix-turn-helix transcriptional regulator n=1 Tax=Streptomyces sp. TaxID=1931 RepID=UPI0025F3E96E|nr:helix-turn-helix transcriptional regulator [Streptomyces sp.]MBW8798603.1 helix-turn-helix transcriptional regulator [Streptomyces sp.]